MDQVAAAGEFSPWQVALSSTEPGSADDMRRLASWLGDAQIVGLGENVHGAHELHRLAHRIFAHLVQEQGFSVFALKVDSAHGMLIDEFVQGQRDDLVEILADGWWGSAPFYDQALRDLLRWMRDYNQTAIEPIHFVGYDANSLAVSMLAQTGAYRYFPPPSRTPTGQLPVLEVLPLKPESLRPLDRALGARSDGDVMIQLRNHSKWRNIIGDNIDLERAPDVAIVVGSVTPSRPL